MRKFLLPIINLVNLILVSISFGLSGRTAVVETISGSDVAKGNFYQLVWYGEKANVLGLVAFFALCVAAALVLVNFLPMKARKCTTACAAVLLIASGVLLFFTPGAADVSLIAPELTGSYIAMGVLVIIAGVLSCAMTLLSLKKEAK